MKHAEKIAPVTSVLAALAALACCLPAGFAASAAAASLGTAVAEYQSWFLAASVILLGVGVLQLRRPRTCRRRPYASVMLLSVSAAIVLLVHLFPQFVAGLLADWLP